MKQWLERHMQTLVGSLGRLWQKPFAYDADDPRDRHRTCAAGMPARAGAERPCGELAGSSGALDVSVYMKQSASLADAKSIADRVGKRRDVADVKLVTAEEALKEFKTNSGFGEALDALKHNPLPHALIVRPAEEFRDPGHVATLTGELKGLPGVDIVQSAHRVGEPLQRDPRRRAARRAAGSGTVPRWASW